MVHFTEYKQENKLDNLAIESLNESVYKDLKYLEISERTLGGLDSKLLHTYFR
jgi:hypothetical protein